MRDEGITGARRRDEEGDFHDLVTSRCPDCGCTVYAAADDRAIVWEPGLAWDEGCDDRDCRCHRDSLLGARRDPGAPAGG